MYFVLILVVRTKRAEVVQKRLDNITRSIWYLLPLLCGDYFNVLFLKLSLSLFLSLHYSLFSHCLLCLLRYNLVSLCRGFMTTELVSLRGIRTDTGVLDVDGQKELVHVKNTQQQWWSYPNRYSQLIRVLIFFRILPSTTRPPATTRPTSRDHTAMHLLPHTAALGVPAERRSAAGNGGRRKVPSRVWQIFTILHLIQR